LVAQPDHPLEYGPEVDALRWAAAAVAKNPWDMDAGARLLRLAVSVQAYFDTHPLDPELESRMEKMRQLVRVMQRDLTGSGRGHSSPHQEYYV
jgi:hypothetical protein